MATWKPEDRTEEQLAEQLGINLWDYKMGGIEIPDQFKKMYSDEMKRSVGQYDLTDLYYKELIQDAQSGNKVAIDTLNRLNKQRGYSIGTKPSLIKGEGAGLIAQHPGRESTEDEKTRFMKKYMGQSAEDKIRKQVMGEADKHYAEQFSKTMKKNKKDIKGEKNVGYYHPSRLPGKMGGEEQRNWESQQRRKDKEYEPTFFKEDPGFVKKEKFLERIMDKRVAPGEELSNAAKTRLYLKEISKNLLERRKEGGKEGTDTLSRIFGGVLEGEEAVTAREEDIIAKRQTAVDQWYKQQKESADINKVIAETTKIQAEALKQDFPEEWQMASLEAAAQGLKPGSQPYNDYMVRVLQQQRTIGNLGEIGTFYTKLADLKQQLLTTTDPDERAAINARIAALETYAGITFPTETENNQSSQSQTDLMKGEEE